MSYLPLADPLVRTDSPASQAGLTFKAFSRKNPKIPKICGFIDDCLYL